MSQVKLVTYQARRGYDFAQHVDGFVLQGTSLGPSGEICALAISEEPPLVKGMFPDTNTETAYTYKVIQMSEQGLSSLELKDQHWNFHFYQPIENDHALLACARSYRHSDDKYDLNAKVFDKTGKLVREFLLGDGIQDLKVTKKNSIWTSYFDEGIFGNYGWEDPVGASGLIRWDKFGSQQYVYPQPSEHFSGHFIDDCYAMNVIDDYEVYFYFYSDFQLAHIQNGRIQYVPTPIRGSDGFVIYRDYILFRGGYENQNQYMLFQRQDSGLKPISKVLFVDIDGHELVSNWVDCRGSELLLQQNTTTYVVDLRDVVQAI